MGSTKPSKPSAVVVIDQMIKTIDDIKTCRMELERKERIDGKMVSGILTTKINYYPYKLYVYNIKPNDGVEIIWKKGRNGNKALVNPNGFPYVSLSLDPMGSKMRGGKNGHYTIFEIGFKYIGEMLKGTKKSNADRWHKAIKVVAEEKINGFDCYKIRLYNPDFKFVDYTVKEGESLVGIARKLDVAEDMIVRNNANVKDFWAKLTPGQVIKVPNTYAKEAFFWVDKTKLVPRLIRMYDNVGLYEEYEYRKLEMNKEIPAEEFSPKYKDYDF